MEFFLLGCQARISGFDPQLPHVDVRSGAAQPKDICGQFLGIALKVYQGRYFGVVRLPFCTPTLGKYRKA